MEQDAYNPPRFWWLKRITCAGIAYMIFLLAVRLWWGWEAQRRLDAAIEERRAAGQPVLLGAVRERRMRTMLHTASRIRVAYLALG